VSQYRPDLNNILLTVQKFINETTSKLQGETKYHAIVASYLLGIAERELRMAPGFDKNEVSKLSEFLKSSGSLDDLHKALAKGVRSGALDKDWDALLDMVLAQTVSDVSVVRPDHMAPQHRPAK
jgi:hypothetical protein